jgi:hypothetical protein
MISTRTVLSVALLVSFWGTTAMAQRSAEFGKTVVNSNITEAEVQAAQEAWGKALVQIGQDFDSRGGLKKATATANAVLDAAYGYNMGPVLFKPTLTHGDQTFRTTKEGALAYFVGGNKAFPNDSGFALKGWQKYEYKNAAVHINGNLALTMGNVMLTGKDGKVTTVDKTWAFKKDDKGQLRIVLHHSSLPYNPVAK